MTVLEVLTIRVGTAVGKSLLKLWLKDSTLAQDISVDVADILLAKLPNLWDRRRTARQLDRIAETVAEKLAPYFESEFSGLPDHEKNAVSETVAGVIEGTPLTEDVLFSNDLDPLKLESYLRRANPTAAQDALLSDAGVALYNFTLHEVCNYIIEIMMNLPDFEVRAARELLQRETELLNIVQKALDNLIPVQGANTSTAESAEFETDYRRAVTRRLDYLELFGVNISEASRRYALSIAYITLSASYRASKQAASIASTSALEDSDHSGEYEALAADEVPVLSVNGDPDEISYLRVSEALAHRQRVLVRGDAGSGKTTLLQWLAVQSARGSFQEPLAEWNDTIPFFIELRRYSDSSLPAPEDFLESVASNISATMPTGWVQRQLESGRALVLIDGIDELSENRRGKVRTWIRNLTEDFPQSRYVVTSRPPAVKERWLDRERFEDTELQPMELDDIDSFISHWHEAAIQELPDEETQSDVYRLGNRLKLIIRESPALRSLATTPLLCAMLCALNRERKTELPKDRMELYRIALEMLLEKRDIEREIKVGDLPRLSLREKQLLLQDFAYWLLLNNRSDAAHIAAMQCIDRKLASMPNVHADTSDVFELLLLRSGLLRQPVEGRVDFIHRTFQEYLAAKEAIDEEHVGLLIENGHRDEWREVIILAAGHARRGQREELISGLLARGRADSRQRHVLHLLAVACLETSLQLSQDLTRELQDSLEQLVPPKNMSEARAVASAGHLAVPLLGRYLNQRVAVATACIRSLALIGTEEALNVLTGATKDNRVTVFRELVRAWSNFDSKKFAQTILADSPLDHGTLELTDVNVLPAVRYLDNLKAVRLRAPDRPEELSAAVAAAEELDVPLYVHLGYTARFKDLYPLARLKSLVELNGSFSGVSDLTPLAALPQLQTLTLDYCEGVQDLSPLAALTELRNVSIDYCRKIDDLSPLKSLRGLRSLSLGGCERVSHFDFLAGFESLRSLRLPGTKFREMDYLRTMTKLRELNIANCEGIGTIEALRSLSELQVLLVDGCNLPSLSGIESSVGMWTLSALGCPLDSLAQIASLRDLRSLSVGECDVTDFAPISGLSRLRYLGLEKCPGLVDLDFLGDCRVLITLNLVSCKQLGNIDAIAALARLESLTLTECEDINSIEALAELKDLSWVHLGKCTGLNDLTPLASLPKLRYLDLSGCRQDLDLSPVMAKPGLFLRKQTEKNFGILES